MRILVIEHAGSADDLVEDLTMWLEGKPQIDSAGPRDARKLMEARDYDAVVVDGRPVDESLLDTDKLVGLVVTPKGPPVVFVGCQLNGCASKIMEQPWTPTSPDGLVAAVRRVCHPLYQRARSQ